MKPRSILTFLLFFVLSISLLQAQRQSRTINDGWRFSKKAPAAAMQSDFDDKTWERVGLPHTWNTDAYSDKNYYRGEAWYRRSLNLNESYADRKIYLRFEAVNYTADVYVNGRKVGTHKGGYNSFTFDITDFCQLSRPNVIAVRVDNTPSDLPPVSADFTMFGGIYRDVWLISVPKQHLELQDAGSNGVYVNTSKVCEQKASWSVRGNLRNESTRKTKLTLTHRLFSPEGKCLKTLQQDIVLKPNQVSSFSTAEQTLVEPQLWSPESPVLYRVETVLSDYKTKEELDKVNSEIGFRWFSADAEKGFFLNGKPYKLHGVCRHQDQKPIGNALSDEMHRRDMKMIKDMGANFIRISHYPQDEAILEQCDKLGILVWEEIPIVNTVPESQEFAEVCKTNLREMIRQHYNHASVVMWGYMNEILLVTQRQYKGDALKPVLERTARLANELEQILRQEDSSRLSTIAFHGSTAYYPAGLGELTDVIGWNLYSGWYGGSLTGFENFLEGQHRDHPNRPILVSEYGAGSDRRLHSTEARCFDFSIEYQQEYLEHYLPVIERLPYVLGASLWNFIDFGSGERDESMPRINNKGLVYNDRTPKDVYYYYQAFFRKDIPVLYIASRDWQDRVTVADGKADQKIKIYTNLSSVELFVNGQSQGVKKAENFIVEYRVPMASGKQNLYVKGLDSNNTLCEDFLSLNSRVIPSKLTTDNLRGLELAVNVGSNCSYHSDLSGLTWVSDRAYTEGGWGYDGGQVYQSAGHTIGTQTQIQGTEDNPLYQTFRADIKAYRFDVPAGSYEVELLFADAFAEKNNLPYNLVEQQKQAETVGNVFKVTFNDKPVDETFNIGITSGYFTAAKKRFVVDVQDHGLKIGFEVLSGRTFLNGIKLRRLNE